uniref:Retrovirus-related Pol polyprotein from transposon TNT 1-94 n=1 Tax=Tanacetum cinerariifolium TaxID=118510 RepID=A0A6L2L3A3_TANCI|nr:hypothetical protein [Tanacetum cinerariifolium]
MNQPVPPIPNSPYRGGSHVTNVPEFDKEDFSSWKDRFLVYLDGLEPYLLEVLKNGPFVPMLPLSTFTNQLTKPQKQWSPEDKKLANQDKRIKSIIISCLPNDVMKSVIKYTTAKAMADQIYELETSRFTIQASSSKALTSNTHFQDSDSDVEEDTMSSGKFLADLNVEFHDRALLGKIEKGLVAESFDWDEESVSFEDERVTKVKAFIAIVEDELSVGKADARSDYTHVNTHYVEDQRKNLLNKFNSLNQEFSHTSSKVTLDQLLTEQVHSNIVRALGGKGERKETISSKEVMFTKADESPAETDSKITSEFESECDL